MPSHYDEILIYVRTNHTSVSSCLDSVCKCVCLKERQVSISLTRWDYYERNLRVNSVQCFRYI